MELTIDIDHEGTPGYHWNLSCKEFSINSYYDFLTEELAEESAHDFVTFLNLVKWSLRRKIRINSGYDKNSVYFLHSEEWGYYLLFVLEGPLAHEACTPYIKSEKEAKDIVKSLRKNAGKLQY